MKRLRPAVFLDRDGTINIEKGYVHRVEEFEYMNGAVEGLRWLQSWGYLLVIITNQSGIARGYFCEEDFQRLTDWMLSNLETKGIHIDGVYYCPHHPEGRVEKYRKKCHCRKPGTGLFYRAAGELDIDLDSSFAIGDKLRDLAICQETGTKGILISCDGVKDKEKEKNQRDEMLLCRNWEEVISAIGNRMRLGEIAPKGQEK